MGEKVPSSGRISRPWRGRSKFANDFRAEKRDDVRTFGKKKAGENLFGDGGAAKDVAAFEDDDLLPCLARYAALTRPLWPPPMTITS